MNDAIAEVVNDVANDVVKSTNVTVKLDASDRERIKALATVKNRTAHYLMKEAIQRYLQEEEAEQRFLLVGESSWDDFEATGLHITLDEANEWAQALKTQPNAVIAACHT
jgi:predicted transcriptional regulator